MSRVIPGMAPVRAGERDVGRLVVDAHVTQQIGEPDPAPARRRRGRRAPRRLTGDVAHLDQARPPIAGALRRRRLGCSVNR
jgi:hypothetical protein